MARDRHPKATLPDEGTTRIWRYMDFWKFEALLKRKALYLCRADKLQDRFEGMYSRHQIVDMERWLREKGYPDVVGGERRHRQLKRKQSFIICWCMCKHDLDLMWKAYTTESQAVAVQSTVERLERVADEAIEHWPLDVSQVTYCDHAGGQHIDYADGFDAVIHKDVHFELDREIRLIHWPNYKEPIPEEVFLPVNLETLIERIVLHPGFDTQPMNGLGELLTAAQLTRIPVESSRDDRPLKE